MERTNSIPADKGIILPSYSGVAFLLSWIYLLFYANSAGIEAAAPVSLMGIPYTLSSVVMSVIIIVIAFGPSRFPELIMRNKMKVASSLGTSVGTSFMLAAGIVDSFWLMIAGAVVTGVFSGVLAQQWVVAYRRIGLKTMISSFPALLAVSTGICMIIMYLPRGIIFAFTVLMPIISGLMLHSVRKSLFPIFDLGSPVKDHPLDFAIMLFPIGIFAFASGFLDFYSYQSSYTYFFYVAISIILLITACVFIFVANRENAFACIVLPLCFFVCIFVPFFTMFNHMPASHFISIGELGIEIALFSVAVGFADFFSINALKSYALCRVVHVFLNAVGWYAGSFSSLAFSDLMNSQASLAVVFIGVEVVSVCLIVAVVKARKALREESAGSEEGMNVDDWSRDTQEGEFAQDDMPANAADRVGVAEQTISLEAKCMALGRERNLSNREMDVFLLLARGFSGAAIQSELYIAAGTVNYHTRNIYSKLNVHSKQELISLVSK